MPSLRKKFSHYPQILITLLVLISIAVFSYGIYIMLDPDFGWHLEMGKLILKSGIPKSDPFSYTMPSFPFIDHEWASNIFMYFIYYHFGKLILAIIYAIFAVLALIVAIPKELFRYSTLPVIFSLILLSHFVNIRPQNETWLLFSILIGVLFNESVWKRFKFIVPLIFLVWANLHAGFALGLAVLTYCVIFKLIKDKSLPRIDLAILGVSLAATFINPYGLGLYVEVFRSMSDSSLRSSIQEWVPLYYQYDLITILILAFSFVFIYKFWRLISLKERLLYIFLFLLAVSSYRHLPFFAIFNIRLLSFGLSKFSDLAAKNPLTQRRIAKVQLWGFLIALELIIYTFSNLTHQVQATSETNYYPQSAVKFLTSHPLKGRIFAPYEWGGYLIWQLPNKKVFVDGRMPSWRRSSAPPGESLGAFSEYQRALYSGQLKAVLAKYQVAVVLWSKADTSANPPSFSIPFLNSLLPSFSSTQAIHLDSSWRVIYQDKVAIIYQKVNL